MKNKSYHRKPPITPLQFFPGQVWEMIVDNLEDSQDVWNLFEALPMLHSSKRLQKKKRLWFFGEILPHMFPWSFTKWLNQDDLLNCRLVCKRWSAEVDSFLESLPMDRAHHPRFQKFSKHQWKQTHTEHDSALDEENPSSPFGGTYFDCSKLDNTDPDWFLDMIEDHTPERSPLLGRSLSIVCPRGLRYKCEGFKNFRNDSVKLHKKIGKEVWHYSVDFRWKKGCLSPTLLIPSYIGRLPNLKGLNINVYDNDYSKRDRDDDEDFQEFMEELSMRIPPLPDLESLAIGRSFRFLSHFCITRFGEQLRRLELEVSLWKPEYRELFPQLEELQVIVGMPEHVHLVRGMLRQFKAEKLTKLQLMDASGGGIWDRPTFYSDTDLFQWVKRFPSLEYLNFGDKSPVGKLKERGTLEPDKHSAKFLKFLKVRTYPGMDYNFFQCLPALQHLQLFVTSELVHEEDEFAVVCPPKLWLQLPKLRTVTLLVESDTGRLKYSWTFNREEYEYRRENRGHLVGYALKRSESIAEFLRTERRKTKRSSQFQGRSSEAKQFLSRIWVKNNDGIEVGDDDEEDSDSDSDSDSSSSSSTNL